MNLFSSETQCDFNIYFKFTMCARFPLKNRGCYYAFRKFYSLLYGTEVDIQRRPVVSLEDSLNIAGEVTNYERDIELCRLSPSNDRPSQY